MSTRALSHLSTRHLSTRHLSTRHVCTDMCLLDLSSTSWPLRLSTPHASAINSVAGGAGDRATTRLREEDQAGRRLREEDQASRRLADWPTRPLSSLPSLLCSLSGDCPTGRLASEAFIFFSSISTSPYLAQWCVMCVSSSVLFSISLFCPLQHKHKPLTRSSSLSRTRALSLARAHSLSLARAQSVCDRGLSTTAFVFSTYSLRPSKKESR